MIFEITITLKVDPGANFLGSDTRFYQEDLEDHLRAVLYDVDDVYVNSINVDLL